MNCPNCGTSLRIVQEERPVFKRGDWVRVIATKATGVVTEDTYFLWVKHRSDGVLRSYSDGELELIPE